MSVVRAEHRTLQLSQDVEGKEWSGDFTFIQAADCQLGMLYIYLFLLGAAHTTPRGEGPQGVGLQA